jgi:hypothetical protein
MSRHHDWFLGIGGPAPLALVTLAVSRRPRPFLHQELPPSSTHYRFFPNRNPQHVVQHSWGLRIRLVNIKR